MIIYFFILKLKMNTHAFLTTFFYILIIEGIKLTKCLAGKRFWLQSRRDKISG